MFEQTGNNDIFYLRERSKPNYIGKGNWDVSMQPKGARIYQLRILMSNNFQMVIGIVQTVAIQWNKGGNNCCYIKPWDAGTEVIIEFSGH